MSKEDKKARNIVIGTWILLVLAMLLLTSSCGSSKQMKKCCEKTAQEVYEYEGLMVK